MLQTSYQLASDPALRFIALLQAALARGSAHVADRLGKAPEAASPWGWRRPANGRRWTPCGVCIGWLAGSDLYLDSPASYQVAQQAAGVERLAVSEQALRHRLHARGLLASIDAGRQILLVRKTLAGCPRHVLHMKADDVLAAIAEAGAKLAP